MVSVLCVTVEDATSSEMADLIKEMEIMKTIGHHTNLRGLLGCCTQSGKCFLVESIQKQKLLKTDIFQSSVATCLTCGGIFSCSVSVL